MVSNALLPFWDPEYSILLGVFSFLGPWPWGPPSPRRGPANLARPRVEACNARAGARGDRGSKPDRLAPSSPIFSGAQASQAGRSAAGPRASLLSGCHEQVTGSQGRGGGRGRRRLGRGEGGGGGLGWARWGWASWAAEALVEKYSRDRSLASGTSSSGLTRVYVFGHTKENAPYLVRSAKLSSFRPS